MKPTLARSSPLCQSTSVEDAGTALATDVANVLAVLRVCVREKGWTLDALEAEMNRRAGGRGFDKSYISRVLNGERPLTLSFILALPDDVEALFESKRAESFGQIVVAPVRGEDAMRHLVTGLVGVLASKLTEPR
jgi:hypothetical protein